MKSIICTECKKPIKYRWELCVAGKLLQPYHVSCLSNPKTGLGKIHKFTGKFPTGLIFWILIIVGNFILGYLLTDDNHSSTALIFFLVGR